jgi:UDP-glucuronate decarboxylase
LRRGSEGRGHALKWRTTTSRAALSHATTSEVYGDPTLHPQPEATGGNVSSTAHALRCNDEAKRICRSAGDGYYRALIRALDTRIIRIFNTYAAPRMRPA